MSNTNPLKVDKTGEQIVVETDRVIERWARTFNAEILAIDAKTSEGVFHAEDAGYSSRTTIRDMLWFLPLEELLETVEITADRIQRPTEEAVLYFYGICWRKRRQVMNALGRAKGAV